MNSYDEVGCCMRVSCLPKVIFNSLTDITPVYLQSKGISALLMDFDNTIVPYTSNQPTDQMIVWLKRMQDSDITLCVVSNSRKPRVVQFCEKYGLSCVTHSRKPFQKGIREALVRHNFQPNATALVGDQIFTDVLGANLGGLTSILITPIHLHNIWLKLRNYIEKPFIFAARGRKV